MDAPALLKCERFVAVRPGAAKRSDLVKDVAETRSGGERFETAHGSVASKSPHMKICDRASTTGR
jgi:hypothetical protein